MRRTPLSYVAGLLILGAVASATRRALSDRAVSAQSTAPGDAPG